MFRIRCIAFLLLLTPAVWPQDAIDIGNRLEPFVDHLLIDRMSCVTLQLANPQPMESVLQFDQPWEGRYCGYVTIFRDGAVVRMYYRGLPESKADGSDMETTCYAESADGIHFTRPNLGLYERNGTRENNIVLAEQAPFSHNFAPFLDERPGVPAEERFKALAGLSSTGLVGYVSGDGIHWKKIDEKPLITKGHFDSQNLAFWSLQEQCYVSYFRMSTPEGFRWVDRCTSPDFRTWTDPVVMDNGGVPQEHIYTNQTVPYFRAPHIYLAIAARFMPGRRAITTEEATRIGIEKDYAGDCSDCVLMSSRGGNHYDRTFMEGFIKPEIGPENWTSRTNYPARGLVQTGENELSMYVQHNYGQTTGYLKRYALRLDGFASVNAPYAGGELQSKPLRFQGSQLHLNFATSAAGSIRVELVGTNGEAIPGYRLEDAEEVIGNSTDRVVRWKSGGELPPVASQPVRLRFAMKDASLYAIQFK